MSAGADGAARSLAEAVRELIEQTTSTDLSEPALAAATGTVRRAVDELRAGGGSTPRGSRIGDYDARNPVEYFRLSPVSGVFNPLAPPLRLEVRDGEVHGECTFGRAYQGPPGYVHGAWVAAAFDELLGIANAVGGVPAMTGRLEIRFHRPTPWACRSAWSGATPGGPDGGPSRRVPSTPARSSQPRPTRSSSSSPNRERASCSVTSSRRRGGRRTVHQGGRRTMPRTLRGTRRRHHRGRPRPGPCPRPLLRCARRRRVVVNDLGAALDGDGSRRDRPSRSSRRSGPPAARRWRAPTTAPAGRGRGAWCRPPSTASAGSTSWW